jgi:hypothetical protein
LAISGKPCNDDIYGYLFREEQARLMLEYAYKEILNFVSSALCILSADQFHTVCMFKGTVSDKNGLRVAPLDRLG